MPQSIDAVKELVRKLDYALNEPINNWHVLGNTIEHASDEAPLIHDNSASPQSLELIADALNFVVRRKMLTETLKGLESLIPQVEADVAALTTDVEFYRTAADSTKAELVEAKRQILALEHHQRLSDQKDGIISGLRAELADLTVDCDAKLAEWHGKWSTVCNEIAALSHNLAESMSAGAEISTKYAALKEVGPCGHLKAHITITEPIDPDNPDASYHCTDCERLIEAAAFRRAAQHWPERYHTARGHNVRCACGWQSEFREQEIADTLDSNVQKDWEQYVFALTSPDALLALDARDKEVRSQARLDALDEAIERISIIYPSPYDSVITAAVEGIRALKEKPCK